MNFVSYTMRVTFKLEFVTYDYNSLSVHTEDRAKLVSATTSGVTALILYNLPYLYFVEMMSGVFIHKFR